MRSPSSSSPAERLTRNPLVSVILPTYNRRGVLGDSVRSVLAQTYRNFELIIVDDGSTDGTAELVRSICPAAAYVWQPHAGVAAARNRGLAEARGQLIALQDSDDLWHPEKLGLQVGVLANDPSVGVVCTAKRTIDKDGRVIGKQWKQLHSGWVTESLFKCVFVTTPSAVVRRRVVEQLGEFDGKLRITSDYQFWLRASLVTKFVAMDEPLVDVRRWPDRLTSAKAEGAVRQYQMLLEFYDELGGCKVIRAGIAERTLAKAALRAGRILRKDGYLTTAKKMLTKSLFHHYTLRAGCARLLTDCRSFLQASKDCDSLDPTPWIESLVGA